MRTNPLNAIDFYKADHRRQYPEGTNYIYSNFTPRSSKHLNQGKYCDNKIVFFGLQYFIRYFLMDVWQMGFFDLPKAVVIERYKRRMDNALGVDYIPMDHIERLHDLRYLPIEIKALPEGSVLDEKIPVLTINNTHEDFFWLVNYLESVLSNLLWKACTTATIARQYRQTLEHFREKTMADEGFVKFQGHDFSFRGMSGIGDAILSGAAHLTSFVGTDTVLAIDFLEEFYFADSDKELVGCSVPATEHSVMCMGTLDNEYETFERLITELYPKGIISIVSDTWDLWKVVQEYLPKLKDVIMARDGKVVIRPDSGNPVKIICGDLDLFHDPSNPAYYGVVDLLWGIFGGSFTENGLKVLDSHIGVIYGDSITLEIAEDILEQLLLKGFASSNIVFGIGSFTYEYVTRDTLGFAMKATYGEVLGEGRDIFKKPKTDNGLKNSAKGLLSVQKDGCDGKFLLMDQVDKTQCSRGELKTVYKNGEVVKSYTLAEIRDTIEKSL